MAVTINRLVATEYRGKCLRRSGQKVARNKIELDGYQGDCLIEPDVKKSKKRLAYLARLAACVCSNEPLGGCFCIHTKIYSEQVSGETSAAAGAAQERVEKKKNNRRRANQLCSTVYRGGFYWSTSTAAISLIISLNHQGKLATRCASDNHISASRGFDFSIRFHP